MGNAQRIKMKRVSFSYPCYGYKAKVSSGTRDGKEQCANSRMYTRLDKTLNREMGGGRKGPRGPGRFDGVRISQLFRQPSNGLIIYRRNCVITGLLN